MVFPSDVVRAACTGPAVERLSRDDREITERAGRHQLHMMRGTSDSTVWREGTNVIRMGKHTYSATVRWTGARDGPTSTYQGYSREYTYEGEGKPAALGSADPQFRGDGALYNPEDMLVIGLSTCHLLSYLAECARGGVYVVSYVDEASGTMAVKDGRMRFVDVLLRPRVTIARGSDLERAKALHARAHEDCYIANSVNFPVRNEPEVTFAD